MKSRDILANLADLERAAADLSQPPQPPRQRADIVMCDWLGAWYVRHFSASSHALNLLSGTASSTSTAPTRKPPVPPA